jgi:hypothetical protein
MNGAGHTREQYLGILHHDACAQKVHVLTRVLALPYDSIMFLLLKIAVLMGLLLFVATASRSVFVG